MKNTVIANRKKTDWPIIKNYFESRGVDTSSRLGGSREDTDGDAFYYGVINGKFDNWFMEDIEQANATILEVGDIVSDTVTLPKSLVLEAHKEACTAWKKRIEEVVPELFPKTLPKSLQKAIDEIGKEEILKLF